MQFSDSRIRVWKLRGDNTSTACIRFRHRGPATGVINRAAIFYTTWTSLVWIYLNLNADRYFSYILRLVVVPYLIYQFHLHPIRIQLYSDRLDAVRISKGVSHVNRFWKKNCCQISTFLLNSIRLFWDRNRFYYSSQEVIVLDNQKTASAIIKGT